MQKRHRIQFPAQDANHLGQDEAYFFLQEGGEKRRIRLHDYGKIFQVPGLYEQVVYERLKCQSHAKVSDILNYSVSQSQARFSELRILDLGAGNGIVGEELKKHGVSRLVGVDIIKEAYEATQRDRPGFYDAYYVSDFCNLSKDEREEISSWTLNCLITVAALGFGDIPPRAFIEAYNLIDEKGWVAFNIKESFLTKRDETGFSKLIRELIFSGYLDIHHLERYQHRLSIEGEPLYYYGLCGRKRANADERLLTAVS